MTEPRPPMTLARAAWLVQLATTLPLVGLIWFVQLVAYPLFAHVPPEAFPAYHAAHSHLIGFLVAPLMMAELGAALAFAADPGGLCSRRAALAGLALALVAWGVTFLVSVPQHAVLGAGFEADAHAVLVGSNWLRTVAWTARGALLIGPLLRPLATLSVPAGPSPTRPL